MDHSVSLLETSYITISHPPPTLYALLYKFKVSFLFYLGVWPASFPNTFPLSPRQMPFSFNQAPLAALPSMPYSILSSLPNALLRSHPTSLELANHTSVQNFSATGATQVDGLLHAKLFIESLATYLSDLEITLGPDTVHEILCNLRNL